jgi:transcriptional regulator with XRE-family HTH domain
MFRNMTVTIWQKGVQIFFPYLKYRRWKLRIPYHFSEQLKWARRKEELTLSELSRRTGIDRRRLAEYENNQRRPRRETALRLASYLGFSLNLVQTKRRGLDLNPLGESNRLYQPKASRHFRVRLNAARKAYSDLVTELECQICERQDLATVLDGLVDLTLDSRVEMMPVLHLLAVGSRIGYISPGSLGYFGPMIIEPKTWRNIGGWKFLAIRGKNSIWFPQVTLAVEPQVRVDFLVCRDFGNGPDWLVVEIDGPGHRIDDSRDLLPFRVVRLTEDDCLRWDFVHILNARLGRLRPCFDIKFPNLGAA